jgi:hypothetical protein
MPGHRPGGGEGLFLSRAGPSKLRSTGTTKPARDQPGAPIRQERDARGRLLQADQGVKGAALRRSPAGPRRRHHQAKAHFACRPRCKLQAQGNNPPHQDQQAKYPPQAPRTALRLSRLLQLRSSRRRPLAAPESRPITTDRGRPPGSRFHSRDKSHGCYSRRAPREGGLTSRGTRCLSWSSRFCTTCSRNT